MAHSLAACDQVIVMWLL